MVQLESIARIEENRKSKNLALAIGSGALYIPVYAGCYMINIDSVENIGRGLIVAGVVVLAGAIKKYISLSN